jgi:hypothetical protein
MSYVLGAARGGFYFSQPRKNHVKNIWDGGTQTANPALFFRVDPPARPGAGWRLRGGGWRG